MTVSVQIPRAPTNRLGGKGGIISGLVMLLCAVFALGVAPAKAGPADANRAIGAARSYTDARQVAVLAKGYGSDDAPAINAAIAAMAKTTAFSSSFAGARGSVLLPSQDYYVCSPISAYSGIDLLGAGRLATTIHVCPWASTFTVSQAVIQTPNFTSGVNQWMYYPPYHTAGTNDYLDGMFVEIADLTVDGQNGTVTTSPMGIALYGGGFRLYNVGIRDAGNGKNGAFTPCLMTEAGSLTGVNSSAGTSQQNYENMHEAEIHQLYISNCHGRSIDNNGPNDTSWGDIHIKNSWGSCFYARAATGTAAGGGGGLKIDGPVHGYGCDLGSDGAGAGDADQVAFYFQDVTATAEIFVDFPNMNGLVMAGQRGYLSTVRLLSPNYGNRGAYNAIQFTGSHNVIGLLVGSDPTTARTTGSNGYLIDFEGTSNAVRDIDYAGNSSNTIGPSTFINIPANMTGNLVSGRLTSMAGATTIATVASSSNRVDLACLACGALGITYSNVGLDENEIRWRADSGGTGTVTTSTNWAKRDFALIKNGGATRLVVSTIDNVAPSSAAFNSGTNTLTLSTTNTALNPASAITVNTISGNVGQSVLFLLKNSAAQGSGFSITFTNSATILCPGATNFVLGPQEVVWLRQDGIGGNWYIIR